MSKHSQNDVDCSVCHGEDHKAANDYAVARIPTPETCAQCHEKKLTQFKKGKHALAWAAMKAMPTAHAQPVAMMEGMKGCGACQTCHMGFDHPQWEMYSASKHGVRYLLKQNKTLPESVAAPACQACHMQEGNHEVRTAWGFLAVRLPMPEDKQWTADRATILQGLGVLDPAGNPTGRLEVVKAVDLARLTQEAWQAERDKMIKTCNLCHSVNFAKAELAKGDDMIREVDHLMAEAIRLVAGLYTDGIIPKPANYAYPFPDLLTFHDAATEVEQELFVMFLEHRMRSFQGAFHANPDYALWYGWSEIRRSLKKVETMAAEMRAAHK